MPQHTFRSLLVVVSLLLCLIAIVLLRSPLSVVAASATPGSANSFPPHNAKLLFSDSLQSNSGGEWDAYPSNSFGGSCLFTNAGYSVTEQQNYILSCNNSRVTSNIAFQVQMKIAQGFCGGIVLRGDTVFHFYVFSVCSNGQYRFAKYVDSSGSDAINLIPFRSSLAIHTGFNQVNKVAIVASGIHFKFYVNNQNIDTVSDTNAAYLQGHIGLAADTFGTPTQVIYKNATLWKLA